MPVSKQKKSEQLEKIASGLKGAETVVFATFKGLTVGETTELRKGLREKGVSYMVAKKTLAERALKDMNYQGELPELKGEFAIAWGTDQIAPAQSLALFQKQFAKRVSIVGGVFEGSYKNESEMTEIAAIPGREMLLGMFLNVINSPIQGLAVDLGAIAEKKPA